jgi:hypothetical protein
LHATLESELHVTWGDKNPTWMEDDIHEVPKP